jgi:hypothetical protein
MRVRSTYLLSLLVTLVKVVQLWQRREITYITNDSTITAATTKNITLQFLRKLAL